MDGLGNVENQPAVDGTVSQDGQEALIHHLQQAQENLVDTGDEGGHTVQLQQAEDGTISYTVETTTGDDGEEEQVILQIHHIAPDGEEEVEANVQEEEEETQNYVIDVSSLLAAGAGHGQIVQMANGQLVQLVRTEDGVQALELEETPEGLQVVQQGEDLQISHVDDTGETNQEVHMVAENMDGAQVVYQVQEAEQDQTELKVETAEDQDPSQVESTLVANQSEAGNVHATTCVISASSETQYGSGVVPSVSIARPIATVIEPAPTVATVHVNEKVSTVESQKPAVAESTSSSASAESVPPVRSPSLPLNRILTKSSEAVPFEGKRESVQMSEQVIQAVCTMEENSSTRNLTAPKIQTVITPSSGHHVTQSEEPTPSRPVTGEITPGAVHAGMPAQVQLPVTLVSPTPQIENLKIITPQEPRKANLVDQISTEDGKITGENPTGYESHDVIHVQEPEHGEVMSSEDNSEVGDVCEYVCPQCNEKTADRKFFLDHLKSHSNIQVKAYSEYCDICGAGVTSKRMMQVHMDRFHKNTDPSVGTGTEKDMYHCSICRARCVTQEDRERHIQEKHFPCKVCGAVLVSQKSLNKHHSQTHQCPCGHIAITRAQLVSHCSEVHNKPKVMSNETVGGKTGVPKPTILMHKRKPNVADHEIELFKDVNLPAKKIKINSGSVTGIILKREPTNEISSVSSSQSSDSPKLNFVCSVCGGRYQNAPLLRQHFSTAHCCSECGKVCATSGELKLHKAMQHKKDKAPRGVEDKPHKCSKCPAAFADHKNLERHMNSHLDNKVYEHMCHICGRGFEGYMVARYKHHLESHFK